MVEHDLAHILRYIVHFLPVHRYALQLKTLYLARKSRVEYLLAVMAAGLRPDAHQIRLRPALFIDREPYILEMQLLNLCIQFKPGERTITASEFI